VAVSGGLDSMALLLLFKNIFGDKIEVFCLTVDHNFRKNSAKDAKFVQSFCQKNSLNCAILKSYLENPPEVDIEGSLREVRYNLLNEFCQKNKIKYLFTAHHQQDLAENFLIRLFRGSGIDGLAAMDEVLETNKIKIIRPLLDFSKDDLKQYLQTKKVNWVEDETNEDEKYLRNKIRKFLQSLPDYEVINSRISLASQAILEAKKILEKETKQNFPKVFTKNPQGLILNIEKFQKLENNIATRYLALALMRVSGRIYKPRLKKLLRVYQLILQNKLARSEEFYGCKLEKINHKEILLAKFINN
jgi:tRNA(Ile)-lysidine synthase